MNNAGSATGTVNSGNTASFAVQIQNALASLDENATKKFDANMLGQLQTIVGRIVECEQEDKELQEQETALDTPRKIPTHPAKTILENRRTHSVAPTLMARQPAPNFDLIDPFSIREHSAKAIKLNQKIAILKKRNENLKEIKVLEQQMLDLSKTFIPNLA